MTFRLAITIGLLAIGLCVYGSSAAQTPPAPETDVTTVAPLVVTPGAETPPLPGATPFSPETLDKQAEVAHGWVQGYRFDICPNGDETRGDFSLGALQRTDAAKQAALEVAANAARAATLAAAEARNAQQGRSGAEAVWENAELTRQAAVAAYQAAHAAAAEAHQRVADMQNEIRIWASRGYTPGAYGTMNSVAAEMQLVVEAKSRQRTQGRTGEAYSLPEGVYVPEEYKDLGLADITARRFVSASGPIMRISGRIVNPRTRAIAIPPLWLTAVDRFGAPLKSEQATPGAQQRIPPGGWIPFTYDLKPLPATAARAVVTFAPRERASIVQLTSQVGCGPLPINHGTFKPDPLTAMTSANVYFEAALAAEPEPDDAPHRIATLPAEDLTPTVNRDLPH